MKYWVVKSVNGRWSLWPSDRELPAGWEVVDGPWSEARCLAFAESAGVEPAGAAPADGDSHAHAIVEAIHRHAERSPSAIALDDGDTRLTYAELWQQADALRQAIHGRGIGPGDRVALVLSRSLAFVVAALACWRCGASYISVDPTSPPDRIASILECARPQLVWTGSEATPGGANWEAQASRASPSSSRVARGGGYVVFTSGSTGTPKGVIVSEPSLAAMVTATIRHFEIGARDAVGALANIAFDAHAIEIWPALSAGARLVMSHERTFDSVERLLSWLATNTISVCWLPTPVTELLIDQGCRLPPSLRVLYTAGQRLTKRAPHWDALRFENAYGPSETTVIATSGPVAAEGDGWPDLGVPLAGVTVRILDESLRQVEPGMTGEIAIGGSLVSDGYLDMAGETMAKFVPDPFSAEPGRTMYRTGDYGFVREGKLHFVGRRDDQVKRNGYRIELGEIEHALLSIDGPSAAVAAAHVADGIARIVAFVVGPGLIESELVRAVGAILPAYMLPDQIVVLPSLPLNANGKVDKAKLVREYAASTRPDQASREAHPLAAIFSDVLGKPMGREDSFFRNGGTSILSMLLLDRIELVFGQRLSFGQLVHNDTPERLQGILTSGGVEQGFAVCRNAATAGSLIPLSGSQRSVVFAVSAADDSAAYRAKARLKFAGELDPVAVETALSEIVRRHGIFRTKFVEVDGECFQSVVQDEVRPDLRVLDLSGSDPEEKALRLSAVVEAEHREQFDLSRPPLARWTLVRVAPGAWELLLTEHHLVHDGWSFNVFLEEFERFYNAAKRNAGDFSPPPDDEATQYVDFALAQRDWLQGRLADRQRQFWKQTMAGASSAHGLPALRGPTVDGQPGGRTLRRPFERDRWQRIERFCAERGTTPFAFVYAVYSATLCLLGGQEDLCVGSAFSNRAWKGGDRLVGMVINTVALRLRLDPRQSFEALLAQAAAVCVAATANQELPFEEVVAAVSPARDEGRNPLFNVFLGFHDSIMPELRFADIDQVTVIEALETRAAKFDLSVVVIPRHSQAGDGDPVHFLWEFDTGILSKEVVERLSQSFESLVQQVLENPSQRLDRLTLWQPTVAPPDPVHPLRLLAEQIVEQAERAPARIACISGDRTHTYADLLHEAGSLADSLARAGVSRGDRVAVRLPREFRTIACILAINTLGAAYVPLSRSEPLKRINALLDIADPKLVVCAEDDSAEYVRPALRLGATQVAGACLHQLACHAHLQSAAYLMFTSGSTGAPKPVVVQNEAISYFIAAIQSLWEGSGFERCLAATEFTFDISGLELFLPLTLGKTIVLVGDEHRGDFHEIRRLVGRHRVDLVQGTPTFWRGLLNAGFNEVVLGLCGGEALSSELARSLTERGVDLINVYGPTETTVWSCGRRIGRDATDTSFGDPLPGTNAIVVNRYGQMVPPEFDGELILGGLGLSAGYFRDVETTAAKFIAHPLFPGTLGYRTGDLVRQTESGFVFLSRRDGQIKLRGHRLEVGEIEATLRSAPGVVDAAVLLRDIDGEDVLCAALATDVEREDLIDELQRFVEESLPQHMVPRRFRLMSRLPVMSSGKLDRRALAALEFGLSAPPQEAPRQASDDSLLLWAMSAFSDVLGLPVAHEQAHFFRMGGHSLKAFRLVALARQRFGVKKLSLADFMRSPTPLTLAEQIRQASAHGDTAAQVPIPGESERDLV